MNPKALNLVAMLAGAVIGGLLTAGALIGTTAAPQSEQDTNAVVLTIVGDPVSKNLNSWTFSSVVTGTNQADLTESFLMPIPFRNGTLLLGWQVRNVVPAPNDTE